MSVSPVIGTCVPGDTNNANLCGCHVWAMI